MCPKSNTISQMRESNINQDKLRAQFASVLNRLNKSLDIFSIDLIIVHCEINERHGVGILIKRIFSDGQGIATVRSKNLYDGQQDFGDYDLHIPCEGLSYPEILLKVQSEFGQRKPRRILSIPYYLEDCLLTIAFKKLFNINLCTFLMDDQNIYANNIPDQIMEEVLELSDLRLGISQPICEAYEDKYRLSFNLLLPVIQNQLIKKTESNPLESSIQSLHGIMIGNIWDQQWLDKLKFAIKKSNIKVDWYANPRRDWLIFKEDELEENGIFFKGYTANEETFIEYLRAAPFAIVPVGSAENDRKEITLLSLPSRIPFMIATANIPIIVVGRKDGAAAKFVEENQLGLVCDYDPDQINQAVRYICQAEVQQKIRKQALKLAENLSADGVSDWIWQSIEQGKIIDCKFRYISKLLSETIAIITFDEINDRHGTAILIKRIFSGYSNIISIRSRTNYGGDHNFGNFSLELSYQDMSRIEIYQNIINQLKEINITKIFCIPFTQDEIFTAIAIKNLYKASLCTYIMDDQNIYVDNINDQIMKELLEVSDLRLGISRQICEAYENKYGFSFALLPPVVESKLNTESLINIQILNVPKKSKNGILVGNIWRQQWLDKLQSLIKNVDINIDWYANPNRNWLNFQDEELANNGIFLKGYVDEEKLVEILKNSPFAIIPMGDKDDEGEEITLLSFPSRIPFIIATANIPIIVLGRKDGAAARFVLENQLGLVCDYDPDQINQAVRYICQAEVQQKIRKQALKLAKNLSADGVADWIWKSLELGKPIDSRFDYMLKSIQNASIIITHDEVTQKHGTGALVKRIFNNTSDIFSIRSINNYEREHDFGLFNIQLSHQGLSRAQSFSVILNKFENSTVKRVFCVPYNSSELISSIAIKEIFNVPLGTYIMDDQNICDKQIPDELMHEFLSKCSIRFATHPELRDAYESKYKLKFWILPAIVPNELIESNIQNYNSNLLNSRNGTLIGSIWSKQWFELLCNTFSEAGVKIDWYGNHSYYWLSESIDEIQQRGLNPKGLLAEKELAQRLKQYPYIVVPTGTLDEKDDRHHLSQLSLPGRIIFAMATSNTPIIILGSEKTSAASFVKRFGIGVVCDYNSESFNQAVDYVIQPEIQMQMRQNASNVARKFSDKDIGHWVWQSLELGHAYDSRFEELFK